MQNRPPSFWMRLPISLRAIVSGFLIVAVESNVWRFLLVNLGVPLAAIAEAIFLVWYVWWASGGGPPLAMQAARATAFRRGNLSSRSWFWSLIGAFFFAAAVHASIVLLFSFVSFPMAAFRQGYDISYNHSLSLKWLALLVSAILACISEETGYHDFM